MGKVTPEEIADKLAKEVLENQKAKRIKVRTLIGHFDYEKRTEENATRITQLLADRNILLNPSIMKLGETWQLKLDDRVYLSENKEENRIIETENIEIESYDYKSDKWFDDILTKHFRTEKEVENKFILPLLNRLNYSDDDRFDGMTINVANGSRSSVLEVDFALSNTENENLEGQILLVVEAKKEDRLYKQVELDKAQKQVKSYAIWLSCRFGLVTDSKTLQIIDLFPRINEMKVIFECKREELKENFGTIYNLISKKSLTKYYEKLNEN
ncbi:type I restriction enzyme HsdR N-terminal domain-containing protein [Flavobacterium sp. HJJ]|uniref:type I restriction enzyme HsdR N-terminal domain-containing protein n=1 Tax=Flavobacterium sp. HJJ TaxID=2783792 RepID=UPI00188CFE83|nr:type I restriction enzyme HsdR N-terminal domain-containing protein [Flavobacterium sp. HJJ]MBF4470127.1 type I restriction enzyme HsdR N-terminal domain-containing protein [Flavobacterium sp. HJJ]